MHSLARVFIILVLCLISVSVYSQTPSNTPTADKVKNEASQPAGTNAAPEPAPIDFWHQETMTGDWGGARSRWKEKGVELEFKLLQFYQANTSGGVSEDSEYNGKFETTWKFDLGKVAGWKYWSSEMKAEVRFGGPSLGGAGAINPLNTTVLGPGVDGSVVAVTALNFTRLIPKDLKKGNLYAVSFGRYNLLDLVDEDFFASSGEERFFNLAQIGPLTVLREVPFITNGASFAYIKGGEPFFTFTVLDPNDHSTDPGIDDLFADGVTFTPGINFPAHYFGKSAKHSFSFAITTKKFTPFDSLKQVIIPGPPRNPIEPKRGSWSVSYIFRQYLVERGRRDGWGLFSQLAFANRDTSPITRFFNVGVGGNGLIKSRNTDEFGFAYAYTGLSRVLEDNVDLITIGRSPLQAEHQVEMFYNLHVAPWLRLTGDLQIIRGVRRGFDRAVVPCAARNSNSQVVAWSKSFSKRLWPHQWRVIEATIHLSKGATMPKNNNATKKPNILIIWGDDIGWFNVSAYNLGLMGYRTPNIDRVAKEGCLFTDWYGQQSCTAGRAAFITGQSPIRTGLTKVGLPGADLGLRPEDPTIADVLKPLGYVCGQFGKNHLGDRDEFLPTAHGFDEFFGNLYHLNAEQEPENPDYPKDPEFKKKFGPRGVLKSWANPDGSQKIENTGPLTIERMKTVDEEFLASALDFIDRNAKDNKPFFCWFNSTRMHIFTHLKKESEGVTGLGVYPDGMVEHDGHVGQLLQKLDDLGIANDTIVMYSTDNGAEVMSWPDGGTTPFRGEKDTNFEGGWRVPCAIRWPGVIEAGKVSNEIFSHTDMLPTLAAVGGDPDIVEKLKKGVQLGKKKFKVHIDGFNLLPFIKGEVKENPRKGFLYWSDDGDLMALRVGNWKCTFMEQRAKGLKVWEEPLVAKRLPDLYNLRSDPFERATEDAELFYGKWKADRAFLLVPAQALVAEFLDTFKEFPPRQKPASFSIDQALEKAAENQKALAKGAGGN